jgi:hypothetical protein
MKKPDKKSTQNLRLIIQMEWEELHQMRNQDWTVLAFITALHFGAYTLADFNFKEIKTEDVKFISFFLIVFCLLVSIIGLLISLRHNKICSTKIGWIQTAEEKLGLTNPKKPEGFIDPSINSKIHLPKTSFLIRVLNCFFIMLDITILILCFLSL